MPRHCVTCQFPQQMVASLTWIAAFIVGCGDSGPTDVEQVMTTISDLPDAARDTEYFDSLFVDGVAPAADERARYSQLIFNVDEPNVSGQTAKVNVHVTNAAGDDLGMQEWIFTLDEGQWKIQQAPLPR